MSSGGAFGGNRGLRPVPLEKGVFPLDHMHLCDLDKKEYLNCLKTAGNKSEICRESIIIPSSNFEIVYCQG
ncbi:cytochrome c oxidase assembly protein COX19-like [Trifolium pratense]|uniref:Uncharacterized protein n=1 Tax=Trifolium pratense TaxID=57577 RepID=A0ACB0L6P8_TRIPR|nr:cytochrome c oxidase assembly protein COX19-like [Trifolium pratense]CAJ2663854.1 unnamed protein product [Trifolium pratense]